MDYISNVVNMGTFAGIIFSAAIVAITMIIIVFILKKKKDKGK